ncbi:hypothetical protein Q3G72_015745 [Acer saccharum]|nr:hypothetical protein Q3G72_015745 [Acer saccharum]
MGLKQDVPTRWNSTYLMLQSAIYYRRAWCSLELSDNNFKHCPCPRTKYPASNLFFPKVFSTYMFLKQNMESSDVFLKKMAIKMYKKYNKYWGEFSVILAIDLILDPRYKMMFVDFAYKKVYGIDSLELDNVWNKLLSLFNEYTITSMSIRGSSSTLLPSSSGGGDTIIDTGSDIFTINIMQFRSLLKPDVVEAIVCTRDLSETLEVDKVVEDILKLTLENSPGPSIESTTPQFGD